MKPGDIVIRTQGNNRGMNKGDVDIVMSSERGEIVLFNYGDGHFTDRLELAKAEDIRNLAPKILERYLQLGNVLNAEQAAMLSYNYQIF